MPFYFLLQPGIGGYQVEGEGTGDKSVTDATYSELKALSDADITALLDETKQQ